MINSQINVLESNPSIPEETVSLEGPAVDKLPNDQMATTNAVKVHVALGDKSPGFEPLKAQLLAGQENDLRQRMAAAKDLADNQLRIELVHKIANDRAKANKPFTKDDVDAIEALSTTELRSNPATIIEKEYASRYVDKVAGLRGGKNLIQEASHTNADGVIQEMDVASNIKMRQEIVKTRIQKLENEWSDSGILSKGANVLGTFVPLLENYRTHNVVKDAKASSILPGNNIDDQVAYLWGLPPQEFHKAFNAAVDELAANNPLMAMTFANKVIEFSSTDKLLDNAFGILDAATLPGMGTAAKLGTRGAKVAVDSLSDVKTALKHAVKAEATIHPKPLEEILSAAGDVEAAARTTVYKDALARFSGQDPLAQSSRLRGQVPSLFNVSTLLDGAANLSREAARRLDEVLQSNASHLFDALTETTKIERSSEQAVVMGVQEAEKRLKDMYPHLNDAVLDVKHITGEEQLTNAHEVEMRLGRSVKTAEGIHGDADALRSGAKSPNRPLKVDAQDPEFKKALDNEIKIRDQLDTDHEVWKETASALGENSPEAIEAKKAFDKTQAALNAAAKKTEDLRNSSGITVTEINPVVEVALGQPDASLFTKRSEADFWAREVYKLKPGEYRTEQQGVGYYIGVRTPVVETSDGVRDLLISTQHQTPRSVMNTFLGALRTPEDTLSTANRNARHLATHGAQEIHRHAVEVAENIGNLSRKEIKRLRTILTANQNEIYEEDGKLLRGVYHKNVGELDQAWIGRFGSAPSEKERAAYFTAVQLSDWDYVVRNLGLYRDKARQGIEHWSFNHRVLDETTGEAAMVPSSKIEGRQVKDVPWNETHDANVFFYDHKTNEGKVLSKNGMTGDERTAITNAIQLDGYRVIQVANPVPRPWSGKFDADGKAVHFIVVKDADRTPLDWQQIPHRAGGHNEHIHEHWVKQPTITKRGNSHDYDGDATLFNFATEAEAVKYAERMEKARNLLLENKVDELEGFLSNNLPYDLDKFTKLFMEQTLNNGEKVPPRFSLTEPFKNVKSGQNVVEAYPEIARGYENFNDQIRSPYNLYSQIDKKYAGERDGPAMTIKERAGVERPEFALETAPIFDPLTALNKGLANVMRSRFLADYKHMSVETFIQEFGDIMKVEGGLQEIRNNPVYYLHNAVFDNKAPRDRVAAAQNAQRAIINLLGTQSEVSQNISWAREQLMNEIYGRAGQRHSDFVTEAMLPALKDPAKYARNVAYHSKLGLYNPVQLFLQAQTIFHTSALAGVGNTMSGMSGYALMRALSLTADKPTIEHFAQMATKLGWKKDDFLESFAALKKSGLWNVEGEVAFKDDIFDPKLFNGAIGKFLDKGTFFFREGERMTRLVSWNAAYLEWKAANPNRVLNNKGIAEILTRQNDLSLNMTRASSAAWQQGIWSVPTQFFAYQARLAEQFLGKRLTDAEKARAFATYSAIYGVPVATGAVTFAWPWYEDMRQSALDRGIDLSPQSPMARMIMEGIPSTVVGMLTGNEQNFAQRAGPGGIKYFREIFKEGKVAQVFGASPNILFQMAGAIAPILKATASPFIPGMADYKHTMADTVAALEEVSTIGNVGKALYALNTGKYISKNEINLGPATTTDALMTILMGTQPLAITDALMIGNIQKEKKAMQDAVKKEVIKNYRRALTEFDVGNDTVAVKHLTNAMHQLNGGDFRPDEQGQIYLEALQGHESLVDKMNQEYIKNSPASVYWQRIHRVFKIKQDGSRD